MDIELIIKGGEELEEYYPKNYEAFREKIGDLIIEMFPGVGGWWFSSELTDRHKKEEEKREQMQDKQFKRVLTKVFKEPEIQDLLRQRITAMAPGE